MTILRANLLRKTALLRRFNVGLIAATVFSVTACSGVAAVLFDIPESRPTPAQDVPVAAVGATAVAAIDDTTRPPIEDTLKPDSALALLPRDRIGNVDWGAARHEGIINPQSRIRDDAIAMDWFEYDFIIESDSDQVFDVLFPHSEHVDGVSCKSCHPGIYRTRGERTTMDEIRDGGSCGKCHQGTISFPISSCFRCHPGMEEMPVLREAEPRLFDDIVFERPDSVIGFAGADANSIGVSIFPHWSHRIRYSCDSCHESLFPMEVGSDTLSHDGMTGAQSCGACHDGVTAFDVVECESCHLPMGAESR